MDTSANFGFLAKQLALSEFAATAEEDFPGGCFFSGKAFNAAVWDPTALGDPEDFINKGLEAAKAIDLTWQTTLLISTPAMEKTVAFKELADALFVYGFPDASTTPSGLVVPSLVQVMGQPALKPKPDGTTIQAIELSDAKFASLLAPTTPEEAVCFANLNPGSAEGKLELLGAEVQGKPVGVVACRIGSIASRVVHLWVEPDMRRKGIAQALVAQAFSNAQERGELVFACWASAKGTLRYFLSKLGFEEQVRAHYFVAE